VITVECETMDSKQASMKRSPQALGWPHHNLKWVPLVEVRKAGAQTSYRHLKVGKERLGALHSQIVKIQSLKYPY
jgi:hypothetical protein